MLCWSHLRSLTLPESDQSPGFTLQDNAPGVRLVADTQTGMETADVESERPSHPPEPIRIPVGDFFGACQPSYQIWENVLGMNG